MARQRRRARPRGALVALAAGRALAARRLARSLAGHGALLSRSLGSPLLCPRLSSPLLSGGERSHLLLRLHSESVPVAENAPHSFPSLPYPPLANKARRSSDIFVSRVSVYIS